MRMNWIEEERELSRNRNRSGWMSVLIVYSMIASALCPCVVYGYSAALMGRRWRSLSLERSASWRESVGVRRPIRSLMSYSEDGESVRPSSSSNKKREAEEKESNNSNISKETKDVPKVPKIPKKLEETKDTAVTTAKTAKTVRKRMSDEEFDRAVRIARAQADVDAILDAPDAPFDLSTELQKLAVSSGGAPVGHDSNPNPNPDHARSELDQLERLESLMYEAAAKGDFGAAQTHKTELDRLQLDDFGHVLHANSNFYKAFSNKDYHAMEQLWLHDALSVCIHPAREPIVGANDVLRAFKTMFHGNTNNHQNNPNNPNPNPKVQPDTNPNPNQTNKLEPVNIRLNVRGNVGIVTCDEEIYTRRFVRATNGNKLKNTAKNTNTDKPTTSSGVRTGRIHNMELVNRLVATNIFRKLHGKWYMVHHHSTFHADSQLAKKARLDAAQSDDERMRQRLSKGASAIDGLTVENVLGIPGHEGFYDKTKTKSKGAQAQVLGLNGLAGLNGDITNQGGSVRRIFTGSLDDLLNGGLKNILSEQDDGAENNEFEELILEEEDDDDDDDDDDDLDDLDQIEEETIIMDNNNNPIRQLNNINNNSNNSIIGYGGIIDVPKDNNKKKKSDTNTSAKDDPTKDSIRLNCIAQLRNLAAQGIISQKQKRLLLTDIILKSAKGEYSMVEVAYDLLCDENDDDDVADEEFAEQCRVFAMAMPELPPLKS